LYHQAIKDNTKATMHINSVIIISDDHYYDIMISVQGHLCAFQEKDIKIHVVKMEYWY